jgi:RNA polymerase sigma factor (sigma-70 family)
MYAQDEDMIQTGMIGLCKAADRWDASKSKFTTYASYVILSEIKMELRRIGKRIRTVSLDAMNVGEDCEDLSFYDVLPGDSDVDYDPTDEFCTLLNQQDKEVLEDLIHGESQREIARKLNCSPENVNRRTRRIRKIWEEEYGNPDKVSR